MNVKKYIHADNDARTELIGCGDLAVVMVSDLNREEDALACYVTVEQARAMAQWLTSWADSREEGG